MLAADDDDSDLRALACSRGTTALDSVHHGTDESRRHRPESFETKVACHNTDADDDYGNVSASYPQFTRPGAATARLNALIEQNVLGAVGIDETCREITSGQASRIASMDEECEVTRETPQFVSLTCHASWDGGAHPDAGARSVNIDRRSMRILEATKLFREGSREQLKRLIREHLDNLGESGIDHLSKKTTAVIIDALTNVVSFSDQGADFEMFWRPNIYVSHLSWAEVLPLLRPEVARALR